MRIIRIPKLEPEEHFDKEVFLNIYTIIDSQSLFDDLDLPDSDLPVLFAWDNESSQIDHKQPKKNRVFQYSEITTSMAVFEGINWPKSRFTDGTFGVWYGALDRDTSIHETLYWCIWFARDDLKKSAQPIINERVLFAVNVKTDRSVNLCNQITEFPDLVSVTDYSLCQLIGSTCHKSGVEVVQSNSARFNEGVCVPVFSPNAIAYEKKISFLKYELKKNGKAIVSTIDNQVIEIPESWGFQ